MTPAPVALPATVDHEHVAAAAGRTVAAGARRAHTAGAVEPVPQALAPVAPDPPALGARHIVRNCGQRVVAAAGVIVASGAGGRARAGRGVAAIPQAL